MRLPNWPECKIVDIASADRVPCIQHGQCHFNMDDKLLKAIHVGCEQQLQSWAGTIRPAAIKLTPGKMALTFQLPCHWNLIESMSYLTIASDTHNWLPMAIGSAAWQAAAMITIISATSEVPVVSCLNETAARCCLQVLPGPTSSSASNKHGAPGQMAGIVTCAVPRHLAEDPKGKGLMQQWLHASQTQQSLAACTAKGLWGPVSLHASVANAHACVL